MRFFLVATFCLASLILAAAATAEEGTFSGLAMMRYAHYEATENGQKTDEGHSFAHQYSLVYQRSGALYKGRGGVFNVALGAEWTGINGALNDRDYDADTFKILYRGEVRFAPGALPFQFRAFSHDMSPARATANNTWAESSILSPNLDSEILDGQHIRTGATLLVGIRNGSYMGRYRDTLSQLPRLLMDYSEDRVKDKKRLTPVDYRMRNLAFVSLNKKDNWFHYRFSDFRDYEEPSGRNDYNTESYILGTIDHMLQRQWINLTNWIKISADGSYVVTKHVMGEEPERRYDVNLFTTASRSSWRGSNFTTFRRVMTDKELSKSFEAPFFANGELDRNTAWRFAFIGSRDQDIDFAGGSEENEETLFASTKVETMRQGRYILSPQIEAEVKQGDRGRGVGARATVEFNTNRLYRPRYELFGSYSLGRFAGTGESGRDAEFWEHIAKARIDTTLNSRMRTGVEERLSFGTGTLDSTVTNRVAPLSGAPAPGSTAAEAGLRSGEVFRSFTKWYGEYTLSRLRNRVTVTYDYYRNGADTSDQLNLTEDLRYDRRDLRLNMTNSLVLGGDGGSSSPTPQLLGWTESLESDMIFRHESTLDYSPGRAWESGVEFDYEWREGDGGGATLMTLRQQCQYNLFKTNGIVRKLADLREELKYERFEGIDGNLRSVTSLILAGNYYPTKRLSLFGKAEYVTYDPEQHDTIVLQFGTALHFQKFSANLNYQYATRAASSTVLDREEHKWDVAVTKTF